VKGREGQRAEKGGREEKKRKLKKKVWYSKMETTGA
jgi:hypothetical protein